jgi:hypothetical protein
MEIAMPIVVITTSPDAQVVLQAGVLDGAGVSINTANKVIRDLPPGKHVFAHTIAGPVGAVCGIKITQGDGTLISVDAPNHAIVAGETDDSIPVEFTVV